MIEIATGPIVSINCYSQNQSIHGLQHLQLQLTAKGVYFSVPADKGSDWEDQELADMEQLVKKLSALALHYETRVRNLPDGDRVDQVFIPFKQLCEATAD